jgi:hypothetical protein
MNNKPLTLKEIQGAADEFFPLFEEVRKRMPKGHTTEDALTVLDHVRKVASTQRAKKEKDERDARFGFLKKSDPN